MAYKLNKLGKRIFFDAGYFNNPRRHFLIFPDGRCCAVFDCGLFGVSDFVYA